MRRRTFLSWSSGKDSAWALHVLRRQRDVEVVGLLTTVNRTAERVAMHAVREQLLRAQAAAVGLPLLTVPIPSPCSNEEYEQAMHSAIAKLQQENVTCMAFGDLFLEGIRRYRENNLQGTGIEPLFPLWGSDTKQLAQRMLRDGLRARVTCVDPRKLAASFAGRLYDQQFLDDLPDGVDPCGEHGEFHSFAFDGPMFRLPVGVVPGVVVERDGFIFADLLAPDFGQVTP